MNKVSKTGSQKSFVVSLKQSKKDLILKKELLDSEKIRPVIDECYPLSKTAESRNFFHEPCYKIAGQSRPTNPDRVGERLHCRIIAPVDPDVGLVG